MLYNRFPSNLPAEQKKHAQQNVPLRINEAPVYMHKYLDTVKGNPFKDNLYVTQVTSVEDLHSRAKLTAENLQKVQQRLQKTSDGVQKARDSLKEESSAKLDQSFQMNQKIMTKLKIVYAKLELAISQHGRLKVDRDLQDDLLHQQKLAIETVSAKRSYCAQISQEVSSVSEPGDDSHLQSDLKSQAGNSLTDSDLHDVLKLMQKQKQTIEVLQSSVSDSAR